MTEQEHFYRVLLVDDEHEAYEFVNVLLASASEDTFDLTWVQSYDDAVSAILVGEYDVCLLDYNLGGYTGLDVLKYIRERGSRIPVIMLTGHGNREVDLGALGAGASEYLDKSRLKATLLARTIRYTVKHQQDRNVLQDLYKQVQELEQLKTDMIRIAAHDLRTPLMYILNYANFLIGDKDQPLADYQRGYAEQIRQGAFRMQRIIGDILSLERVQATAEERYQQTVNVTEQVHLAADAVLPKDDSRVVELHVPGTPVLVKGDPAQLHEAASNLMTNAVKYTPEGASITVSLAVESKQAVFRVIDTGYGIPDDMQARLFQPFYRAKSKETRKVEGTGLGLHLVRNIAERHRGKAFFESVYGEGSMFGFWLPLLEE
jgi:signal transduction histidine kinase